MYRLGVSSVLKEMLAGRQEDWQSYQRVQEEWPPWLRQSGATRVISVFS